jgi:hypothetical protein
MAPSGSLKPQEGKAFLHVFTWGKIGKYDQGRDVALWHLFSNK